MQLTLTGNDANLLDQTATALEDQLRGLSGISSVSFSAGLRAPKVQINPDFARAAALGTTSPDSAAAVRVATSGDCAAQQSKLHLPQRQIPISVQLDGDQTQSLDAIKALQLMGNSGCVPLESSAAITVGGGRSQIDRLDRSRNVSLSIDLNGGAIGEAA